MTTQIISWFLGVVVLAIGVANLLLVQPVPGIAFIVLSLIIMPTLNSLLTKRFGFSVPFAARVVLGVVAIWFTLGVSDLGDMID